jgi:hypothetical protein
MIDSMLLAQEGAKAFIDYCVARPTAPDSAQLVTSLLD